MIGIKNLKGFELFAILSFMLCFFYALVFQPLSLQLQGDSHAYIELAKEFLGRPVELDLSHRQPLYSVIIAFFIAIFGEASFEYPLMYFQYLLIFSSSLIIYKLFELLDLGKKLPFIVGMLYLLNLSTINYGYAVLTETTALFLFVLIVFLLVKYAQIGKLYLTIIIGVLSGLIILARFNTLGLPAVILFTLVLIHYYRLGFSKPVDMFKTIAVYGISLFFVLNIWMLYNMQHRGFYGIIQKDHPRFALVIYSRIDEGITVSEANNKVLEIFLNAKQKLLNERYSEEPVLKKGSLLNYPLFADIYAYFKGTSDDRVGGWALYKEAMPDLFDYFDLDEAHPESVTILGDLLKPFNKEVREQTKNIEIRQRFSALFQTFRHSGVMAMGGEKVNLNFLPSFVFLFYRLLFMGVMAVAFIVSGFIVAIRVWKIRGDKKLLILLPMIMILYFPLVHFYAITPGDANRFKFPAEPIAIGLFIYYVYLSTLIVSRKLKLK